MTKSKLTLHGCNDGINIDHYAAYRHGMFVICISTLDSFLRDLLHTTSLATHNRAFVEDFPRLI
jgi:hypothetical protein